MNTGAAVKSLLGEMHAKLASVALHPRTLREIREISDEIALLATQSEPLTRFEWSGYELTKAERRLCEALLRRIGREISLEQIYASLYEGKDNDPEPKIIDVMVCHIRAKLDYFSCPYAIQTIRGIGYKLVDRAEYRRYVTNLTAAARYIPQALRVPIQKMGQRVYLWEGVRMGPELATIAMKLKGAQGQPVPIHELGPRRGPVQVQIYRLNKKMAGLYQIRLVSERDGYVMCPVHKPALEAVRA